MRESIDEPKHREQLEKQVKEKALELLNEFLYKSLSGLAEDWEIFCVKGFMNWRTKMICQEI